MSLRIAFDLDGVLADMESELVRQAEQLFGEQVQRRPPQLSAAASEPRPGGAPAAQAAPPSPDGVEDNAAGGSLLAGLNLTSRQQRRLWRHVESIDSFWETLKEIEAGSVSRLAGLAAERRWEMIFLTKRPASAGPTPQLQTQRWLTAHGFSMPSVFVVQGSRGRIAASLDLDFVVDDRPENCLDVVADSEARSILVWRDDEKFLPVAARRLGIGVVRSVAECLDILTQVDSTTQGQPRVVDRVRRLLGLKEKKRV